MGQKVSPVGLRVGINKTWESKWYASNKDFAKYLNNDVQIRKFLEKKLKLPKWLGNLLCGFILKKENRHNFREKYVRK